MADLLWPMTQWHWLALGILLIAAETLLPGFILMWFGVGAIVTGVALWLTPEMTWHWQLLIFALISVAAIVLWRARLKNHPTVSDQPSLNQKAAQFIGRDFVSPEGIKNGVGRITVGDTSWRAEGQDCPPGSVVEVIGVEGATIKVVTKQ